MFSDKFTEINNYSLLREEYVSTSSIMPWRYTSIFDEKYKPDLEDEIKNRLLLFFYFRLQYSRQLLEDDKKYIEITHNNGDIIEFRAINPIKLIEFMNGAELKHFISTIESPQLDSCIQKIIANTKEDVISARLTSFTFDKLCNSTGVYCECNVDNILDNFMAPKKIFDAIHDIDQSILSIHINLENNSAKYKITPFYPVRKYGFKKVSDKTLFNSSNYVPMKVEYNEYTDKAILSLLDNELITESMVDFINSVMPVDTKFEMEYITNSFGEIEDIIFKNIITEEFENVCEQQNSNIYKY